MAKNSVSDWSTTAADNTDVGGIAIQGTNNVKNFDNALRETMAQIATLQPVGNAALIGQVGWFAMTTAPTGWLKANGAAISRTTYADLFSAIGTTFGVGDGSTTFNLPDLRGEFVRAYDDGRGIDAARVFGSFQNHALQDHYHKSLKTLDGTPFNLGGTLYDIFAERGAPDETAVTGYIGGSASTAAETRPRNVALLACIKY